MRLFHSKIFELAHGSTLPWKGARPEPREKPKRHFRLGLLLAAALGPIDTTTARASPIVPFDGEITALTEYMTDSGVGTPRVDIAFLPGGVKDPAIKVGSIQHHVYAAKFPTAPPGNTNDFIAAEVWGDGRYGAGASAVGYSSGQNRKATATFQQSFAYGGTDETILFQIEPMRVGVAGTPVMKDLNAKAQITAQWEITSVDGSVVSGTLFDFWVEITKVLGSFDPVTGQPVFQPAKFQLSDDLFDELDKSSDLELLYEESAFGIGTAGRVQEATIPPFQVLAAASIKPGQELFVELVAHVETDIGAHGVEGGAQALAGDPFNLIGTPRGPVVHLAIDLPDEPPPPTAVPLPASVWLLGCALVFLGLLQPALRQTNGAACT